MGCLRACLLSRLFIIISGLAAGHPVMAGEVSLGVAANFTNTTRELVEHFEKLTGHKVTASYGSTGKLYAQIRHGAPYDVFMAADTHRPALIGKDQTGVADTRFTYATGKLVLWRPTSDQPDGVDHHGEAYLRQQPFQRLAIANPKTAPYGLAAKQVLSHLGLWPTLQPKLVRGDSIAQTFQFVVSRNAQAGFVALSQINTHGAENRTVWMVPQAYYQPIEQQAILLNRGKANTAARAWMTFLKSDDAITIIRRHGYDTGDQRAE